MNRYWYVRMTKYDSRLGRVIPVTHEGKLFEKIKLVALAAGSPVIMLSVKPFLLGFSALMAMAIAVAAIQFLVTDPIRTDASSRAINE